MTPKERADLANRLRRAANLISLPAFPGTWPDWMTQEKRESMAKNFRDGADDLARD